MVRPCAHCAGTGVHRACTLRVLECCVLNALGYCVLNRVDSMLFSIFFRLFPLVLGGSTLLFSQAPVSKSHAAASFFGGSPVSTEVMVRWVGVRRSHKSRALSLDQRSASCSDFVTNMPVGFIVRSCRSTILEIIVDCYRNNRPDNRTGVLTVYKPAQSRVSRPLGRWKCRED